MVRSSSASNQSNADSAEPLAALSLTKAEYEALARFRYGVRRYLRFSEEAVRAAGLTPQQYQLMLAIKGYPSRDWATVGEVAERLQIRHNSAVGLADRCQRLGLVQRDTHPADRRAIALSLTDDGERMLVRLVDLHRAELGRLGDLLELPQFGGQAPG